MGTQKAQTCSSHLATYTVQEAQLQNPKQKYTQLQQTKVTQIIEVVAQTVLVTTKLKMYGKEYIVILLGKISGVGQL